MSPRMGLHAREKPIRDLPWNGSTDMGEGQSPFHTPPQAGGAEIWGQPRGKKSLPPHRAGNGIEQSGVEETEDRI